MDELKIDLEALNEKVRLLTKEFEDKHKGCTL